MLGRGLLDRVTVQYQGQAPGPQFSQDSLIESISHTIVMDGSAEENGRPVMSRTILSRFGDTLRLTRMTRSVGEPFLMRLSYEMKRNQTLANAAVR